MANAHIYANDAWGFGSGIGSLPETTLDYRHFLETFIAKNGIETIVDFGCGDWQFSRYIYWWGAAYTGYDTVAEVIARNTKQFSTENVRFLLSPENFDGIRSAQLLLVKDVLQHWSLDLIHEFLASVKGKFEYILITNSHSQGAESNSDIRIGQFRPLNLLAPPFNLPAKEIFSYNYRCSAPNGKEHSDVKTVLLLQNW